MIVMDVIVSAAISSILAQFLCILSYRTNQDPKSESLKGARLVNSNITSNSRTFFEIDRNHCLPAKSAQALGTLCFIFGTNLCYFQTN